MIHKPLVQVPVNLPHWYVAEAGSRTNLHYLIARLSHFDSSATSYVLADGLRHLAEQEIPKGLRIGHGAFVTAVERLSSGAWRLQVGCPHCAHIHTHDAGKGATPKFGQHKPPCGGGPYWLRIDDK